MTRHAHTRSAARPRSGSGQQQQHRRRTAGERLLGLLSLLILLALMIGVPAALVALRGNPLPHAGVDRTALINALTRPDDGSLFLCAVTWLAWAGWAVFALSVLIEVPAQLRGLPSPRLPALGMPQRAASSLVAGAALLFTLPLTSLTSPLTAPAADPRPAAAMTVQQPPMQHTVNSTVATTQVDAHPDRTGLPHYTVVPGDSLWRIAERQLGDGARYQEIAELNYGLVQLDGRALASDHWIRPGWTLTLPPDARSPRSPQAGPHTVVVQPGDTLSQIARDTMGDAALYEQIAAASTGLQPDGAHLTNPNLIRPGWHLTIPDGPAGTAPRAARGQPASPAIPRKAAPPAATEDRSRAAPDLPLNLPRHSGPPPGEQNPPVAASAGPASGRSVDVDPDHVTVRTTSGVGALLAAGLLVVLGSKRARQQRRRRPGQRIAMPPPELAETELELRLTEDPASLGRVDQALRTLSLLLGQDSRTLPALRLARLRGDRLELTLDVPESLPAPFTRTEDPRVWTLPGDAMLPSAAQLATVPAPYPSLVTLGHDHHGAQVLVDLEHSSALRVVGTYDEQLAILAAVAAELATSPWADDLQITLVDCLEQLPTALGTGRLRHVESLEQLLPALERRAEAVQTALTHQHLRDLRQARSAGPDPQLTGDGWTPEILLLGGAVPLAQRDRLEALLQDWPNVGIALITTGDTITGEWSLTLDRADPPNALLEPISLTLQPQRLTSRDLDHLFSLLAVADQPSCTPSDDGSAGTILDELRLTQLGGELGSATADQDGRTDQELPRSRDDLTTAAESVEQRDNDAVPTEFEAEENNDDSDADSDAPLPDAPLVRVLGPVEILNAHGPVEPSKMRQLTEIATFMALHPGSDHHGLSEAIWPGARALDNTRNTAVSKLRKWLGVTHDGTDYVPRVLDDGYRLHPHVRTDWQMWQELLPAGPATASNTDLAAALDLVKGRPFAGTNPRRYAWAERERQDMISAIVDASHELTSRALLVGDATLARSAAAAGLHVDPGAELLWRDALKAEWLAGDREGLITTADRLTALVEELGDDLEPETIALMDELLRRQSRHVGIR